MSLFDLFWGTNYNGPKMKQFSTNHILVLIVTFICLYLMYKFRYTLRKNKPKRILGNIIGIGLLVNQLVLYIWYIETGWFNIHDSLPLYLCRLSAIFSIIMVLRRNKKIFDVIYFWGFIPAFIALFCPDINYFSFPHIRYWLFFTGHMFIEFAVFYMIFIIEYIPNFESFKRCSFWSVIYLIFTMLFNFITNSNYSYLNGKPESASPLDILPAFPNYLPIMIGFLFLMLYLSYLPFKVYEKKNSQKNEILLG